MHDDEPIIEDFSPDDSDDSDEIIAEEATQADTIKTLRAKLKACQSERQEYLAGWQRSKADYINLKKTHEADRGELLKFAKAGIIEELLSLADSFEMAFANKNAWEAVPENWRKGVEYIYNQLQSIFRNHGLEEIKAEGTPFKPEEHQALGTIPVVTPVDDHRVLEVSKKGYTLNGKVIRPAHVKIGEFKKN